MKKLVLFDTSSPMDELLRQIIFTRAQLRASTVAAFLLSAYDALYAEWLAVNSGDIELQVSLG